MQHAQMEYPASSQRGGADWSREITVPQTKTPWRQPGQTEYTADPSGQLFPAGDMPQMQTGLPTQVIDAPLNLEEAHQGSLKAMLSRNEGNYVVATFLVGTQGTVSWEGVLYDVGNDFITIYQPGRERYVVIDIYALKYIEFYDTRRREECEAMLKQNGWQNQH